MIMLYFLNKVVWWYIEIEFEGKIGLVFLKDGFVYVKNYVLDNRLIIFFEWVKEIEEFLFKC